MNPTLDPTPPNPNPLDAILRSGALSPPEVSWCARPLDRLTNLTISLQGRDLPRLTLYTPLYSPKPRSLSLRLPPLCSQHLRRFLLYCAAISRLSQRRQQRQRQWRLAGLLASRHPCPPLVCAFTHASLLRIRFRGSVFGVEALRFGDWGSV